MEVNCLLKDKLPAPMDGGFHMKDYWIWCGSVIKGEDSRYHMFASRWSKEYSMHPGWIFQSEIVRAVADKPEGPYTYAETVLPQRGAQYWDGRVTHNPFITKCEDTYILYYMGTTFPFHKLTAQNTRTEDEKYLVAQSNKRIGIATSKSIFGPWIRRSTPVLNVRPDHFDSFLTSNPAPYLAEDGSVHLVYKARSYVNNAMGKMLLGAAYAKHYEGPYDIRGNQPLFSMVGDSSEHGLIEDPFIWREHSNFYMIAKDMTGIICGEKYAGLLASSSDGLDWKLHHGIKTYSRSILWNDGKIREMGSFERPFILFEDQKPRYLFAATSDGTDGFGNAANTWNMVIPLAQ